MKKTIYLLIALFVVGIATNVGCSQPKTSVPDSVNKADREEGDDEVGQVKELGIPGE
jgi:hypothetical protein